MSNKMKTKLQDIIIIEDTEEDLEEKVFKPRFRKDVNPNEEEDSVSHLIPGEKANAKGKG